MFICKIAVMPRFAIAPFLNPLNYVYLSLEEKLNDSVSRFSFFLSFNSSQWTCNTSFWAILKFNNCYEIIITFLLPLFHFETPQPTLTI